MNQRATNKNITSQVEKMLPYFASLKNIQSFSNVKYTICNYFQRKKHLFFATGNYIQI